MHHFERGISPVDFKVVKIHYVNWNTFGNSHEHRLLGDTLYERQHHYCAYCETHLKQKSDGHIEHLVRRNDMPQKTFDWNNMFFSCNNDDSCGNFKDNRKNAISFDEKDIIDPSREHPQDFFSFDRFGHILPAKDLTANAKKRAEETIRVFNLNSSERIRNLRQQAARVVAAFLQCAIIPDDASIDRFLDMVSDADCLSVYYSLLGRRMP